ncbi:hypothetical protein QKW52_25680 [Bacillus sonorensis]|nr:hypothetical protein [Bacillus sonorensis]TWK77233.1 hypothetical protein CHCC20335_2363 [Bacillus paralicheniformis]
MSWIPSEQRQQIFLQQEHSHIELDMFYFTAKGFNYTDYVYILGLL